MTITAQVSSSKKRTFLQRQIMLPHEHGAWIFLASPLLIGLALGGRLSIASFLVVIAVLAAFLLRQPVTILVKILSGRRPSSELPAARFWLAVYGLLGLLSTAGLVLTGYSFILLLIIPAIPVLGWHLWLVSRRAERHQMAVELAGSAVLALAAPAAYWVGRGHYDGTGWLLWALAWLQTAGSIVYTYLRLTQHRLSEPPNFRKGFALGKAAVVFNSLVLMLTLALAVIKVIPGWLPAAFALQALEVLWGIYRPAVHAKPGAIGTRQLVISSLFTLIFILAWF